MSEKMISFPSSLVTAPRLALVIGCLVPVKIKPQKRKVRHKHAAVLTAGPDGNHTLTSSPSAAAATVKLSSP